MCEVMGMHMTDLIEKKKQGLELTEEEIRFIVNGYTAGDIPDYQMSALMMAILFRGMTIPETTALTMAMVSAVVSGIVMPRNRIAIMSADIW